MTNRQKSITLISVTIVLISFTIVAYMVNIEKSKVPIEITNFENTFQAKLPKDTSVLFSHYDYGAMGDGSLLYVYKLNDVNSFVNQFHLQGWSKLPINTELANSMQQRIDVSGDEVSQLLQLKSIKNGYFLLENSEGMPIHKIEPNSGSKYNNGILGVINTASNLIYFYQWDQ